ncbi:hypothetical protein J5N97_006629 [Dioscorea zingiberensis]|uniref:Uncharacterized protein n=1 Tax=Dioscorea zingiberensis TaxID=325984 RepID=A0A9D5DAH7_9LILI|nr:hypothetical protein J5N97_006629 [Dioscorea zingiberensis]
MAADHIFFSGAYENPWPVSYPFAPQPLAPVHSHHVFVQHNVFVPGFGFQPQFECEIQIPDLNYFSVEIEGPFGWERIVHGGSGYIQQDFNLEEVAVVGSGDMEQDYNVEEVPLVARDFISMIDGREMGHEEATDGYSRDFISMIDVNDGSYYEDMAEDNARDFISMIDGGDGRMLDLHADEDMEPVWMINGDAGYAQDHEVQEWDALAGMDDEFYEDEFDFEFERFDDSTPTLGLLPAAESAVRALPMVSMAEEGLAEEDKACAVYMSCLPMMQSLRDAGQQGTWRVEGGGSWSNIILEEGN